MRSLFSWLRTHRLPRIFLGLVIAVLGLHFFANWRGEKRWENYVAEARARGVKMSVDEIIPPAIPAAENFAALPMLSAIFNGGNQHPMLIDNPRSLVPDPLKGERIDWIAWQAFFLKVGWITDTTDSAPGDVLRGLEHFAPEIAQWHEWPQRPRARYPLDWKEIVMPLPHISTMRDAEKIFALRLRAHLALGDSAAAYADFQDTLQAYRAIETEPFLIGSLVRVSILRTLLNAVGDGLQNHAWNEAELQQIDAALAPIQIWKSLQLGLEGERIQYNRTFETHDKMSLSDRVNYPSLMNGLTKTRYMGLAPKRVFRDNQLRGNLYLDEQAARISPDGLDYDPEKPTPSDPSKVTSLYDRYYFYPSLLFIPVHDDTVAYHRRFQAQLDAARVAIALERFRIAHGTFPEKLEELVPQYLSEAATSTRAKEPLLYRRTGDGSYELYGVGKNRKDDGGRVDPKLRESKQLDDVWLFAPPKSAGAPK